VCARACVCVCACVLCVHVRVGVHVCVGGGNRQMVSLQAVLQLRWVHFTPDFIHKWTSGWATRRATEQLTMY